MKLTVQLAPEDRARFDRLMNYLEGSQQAEIDRLTAQLQASTGGLKATIDRLKEE